MEDMFRINMVIEIQVKDAIGDKLHNCKQLHPICLLSKLREKSANAVVSDRSGHKRRWIKVHALPMKQVHRSKTTIFYLSITQLLAISVS